MAQRVVVELTSDLSGEAAQESVSFSVDGVGYEIDLTEAEASTFREALASYTAAARKIGRTAQSNKRSSRTTASSDYDASAVRAWATANKIEVSERGRISKDVLEQYRAAGN